MFTSSGKYDNDINEAYIRGLEQGFELARRLEQIRAEKSQASSFSQYGTNSEETPLLFMQLIDIAERKGITLR